MFSMFWDIISFFFFPFSCQCFENLRFKKRFEVNITLIQDILEIYLCRFFLDFRKIMKIQMKKMKIQRKKMMKMFILFLDFYFIF